MLKCVNLIICIHRNTENYLLKQLSISNKNKYIGKQLVTILKKNYMKKLYLKKLYIYYTLNAVRNYY